MVLDACRFLQRVIFCGLMRKNSTRLQPVFQDAGNLRNAIVIALWSAILLGICIRIGLVSRDHDVFATYADAGRRWINSQTLYTYTRGFVYSPLVAALFAPLSWFPPWLGGILWRLLTSKFIRFLSAYCLCFYTRANSDGVCL
jgi:hypothetical protein